MAIGGVKKEVCKLRAINIAKKYGLTSNNTSKGKNIGTNIKRTYMERTEIAQKDCLRLMSLFFLVIQTFKE